MPEYGGEYGGDYNDDYSYDDAGRESNEEAKETISEGEEEAEEGGNDIGQDTESDSSEEWDPSNVEDIYDKLDDWDPSNVEDIYDKPEVWDPSTDLESRSDQDSEDGTTSSEDSHNYTNTENKNDSLTTSLVTENAKNEGDINTQELQDGESELSEVEESGEIEDHDNNLEDTDKEILDATDLGEITPDDHEILNEIEEGWKEIESLLEDKSDIKEKEIEGESVADETKEEKPFKGSAKKLEIEPVLDDAKEDLEIKENLSEKQKEQDSGTKTEFKVQEKKSFKGNAKRLEIEPVIEGTEEDKEVDEILKEKEAEVEKEKEELQGEDIYYDKEYNVIREIYCELEGPIVIEQRNREQEYQDEFDENSEEIREEKELIVVDEIIEEMNEQLEQSEEQVYEWLMDDLSSDQYDSLLFDIDEEMDEKKKEEVREEELGEYLNDREKEAEISKEKEKERKKEIFKEQEHEQELVQNEEYYQRELQGKKRVLKEKEEKSKKLEEELKKNEQNRGLENEAEQRLEQEFIEKEENVEQEKESKKEKRDLQELLENIQEEIRQSYEKGLSEEWEHTLREWIETLENKGISEQEKQELLALLRKFSFLRRLYTKKRTLIKNYSDVTLTEKDILLLQVIQNIFDSVTPLEKQLFINLKSFRDLYNKPHLKQKALAEREKFMHHLFIKLTYFKLLYYPSAIPSAQLSHINWVEMLKKKLSRIKDLDQESKAVIEKILTKEEISKVEKKQIIVILSLLPTETLVEIFGKLFAYHTTQYIRWGWEFYRSTKQLMLERFFNLSNIAYNRIREIVRLYELEKELQLLKKEVEKLKIFKQKKKGIKDLFPEIQDLKKGRTDLMKQFEHETSKNAIWRGSITQNYINWVETEIEKIKDILERGKLIIYYLYFLEQKFKKLIKENLYKITKLNLKEKSKIVEIISKNKFMENDLNVLKKTLKDFKDFKEEVIKILDSDRNEKIIRAKFLEERNSQKSMHQIAKELKDIPYSAIYKRAKEFWGNDYNKRFEIRTDKERIRAKEQKAELIKYLNSMKNEMLSGKFLPSKKNILRNKKKLKDMKSLTQERSRWIRSNTPFKNYTNLKKKLKGIPAYEQLRSFLDSIKVDIKEGRFIPTKQNIIDLRQDFLDYDSLTHIVRNWIKENSRFENITELKKYFLNPYPNKVRNFLESKRQQIIDGGFIPDRKNIVLEKPEFENYKYLTSAVVRWLSENTKFENITDWKENFLGTHIREQIRNFLNTNKKEILKGKFIPTSKNLRRINREFGDYDNSHIVVSEWLEQNSKFKNLSEMIKYFKTSKNELGLSIRHGYTPNFSDEDFKIKNALFQVVKILDKENLIQYNDYFDESIETWSQLFTFLENNPSWHFIDVLTGEIIDRTDYNAAKIAFHHIDRDKLNDNHSNLVFILNTTHGFFTIAQRFDEELDDFFISLLNSNMKSIANKIIPLSWKTRWRDLANMKGIKIDPNRYIKEDYNKKILESFKEKKTLEDWL